MKVNIPYMEHLGSILYTQMEEIYTIEMTACEKLHLKADREWVHGPQVIGLFHIERMHHPSKLFEGWNTALMWW